MLATAQERIQFYKDKPLTIGEVLDTIRQMGLTCSYKPLGYKSWEFRVNHSPHKGGTEATAYYTEDRQDAIDTAKRMKQEWEARHVG